VDIDLTVQSIAISAGDDQSQMVREMLENAHPSCQKVNAGVPCPAAVARLHQIVYDPLANLAGMAAAAG
jgi:hypothetical protein